MRRGLQNTPPSPVASPAPSFPRAPWLLLISVALLPAIDALLRLGRLHPDEVYQSLDPAMQRAFGFGVMAWEWEVGLRNWATPGLFALLLKGAHALHIDDVMARRAILEVPQFLLHLASLVAVFRFSARRIGPTLARYCVPLVGLYPPILWFAGRPMSESTSTAFILWGLERLDAALVPQARRAPALAGGLLLGAAEVARYGSAAVILPVLLFLAVRAAIARRHGASEPLRALVWCCAGGALVALGLGALDRLTWGVTLPSPRWHGWFHSLLEYLDFNILSGRSGSFGRSPWYWYWPRLWLAPWAVVGLACWRALPQTRAWLVATAALGYLVAVTVTEHKESRFLYPALALVCMAGAPAFVQWVHQLRLPAAGVWWRRIIAALSLASLAAFFVVSSPFDVGRPEQFQLTVKAGREGTGLVIVNEGLWGSGGFFYLGKQLPWCTCDFPSDPCFRQAMSNPAYNRGIFMSVEEDPERNARTIASFEASGFRLEEKRGLALYFVR